MDAPPSVLVLEDKADGRLGLCGMLECDGYRVTEAETGADALALLAVEAFDAVILDLGLPDVDGIELICAARLQSDPPAVIVFSGHHGRRAAAEAAGCDAFVLKPSVDELLAQLGTAVVARRDRATARRAG